MPGAAGKSGGKRKGAGRKSKAEEAGLKELLDTCWPQAQRETFFRALARKATKNVEAAKLLMAYAYGKPTEKRELTGPDGERLRIEVVYVDRPIDPIGTE